jgi:hypothetical protein
MGSKVVPAPDTSRWRFGRHNPSHLGKYHVVGRARGDTGCSGGHPCLRVGTTRIVRHVTTRGEHYAHSSKDDRSAGVSERQALRHAVSATYALTGVASLPSPIDLLQKRSCLRPEHALLFGWLGDGNDRQPGSLSSALQRSLHAVTRCPPPGTTWASHSL